MRWFYSLIIYLATPLILIYAAIRGLRDRDYLKRWPERFGFFEAPEATGGIVIHAASVGEVNAAAILIKPLRERFPGLALSLTTFTPTGSGRALELFRDEVFHVYAPLDYPGAARRFFDRVRPGLLIIMETEIWPNLYHEASRRDVPLMIANARISLNSIKGYRRFRWIIAPALGQVSFIGAQSQSDAARLIEIGADPARLEVTGNLKFDMKLPPSHLELGEAIRQNWGASRPVLLAGSTHEGDEQPVIEAFRGLLKQFPNALLVLVPRHPERFGRAAQLARTSGLVVSLRSEGINCPPSTQCFLIDTMGELLRYYAACDVAFVGGSLASIGGHNALEPAALAKPVLLGPHTFNFEDITDQLLNAGAAIRVTDARDLEQATVRLFSQPDLRDQMGQAGLELVRSGQGALQKTLEIVQKLTQNPPRECK
jgi:3-deoxy-D-manno-octulosonic-acid transferase